MSVHENSHVLLRRNDVIRYQGKVWVVLGPSDDKTAPDRKFPDLYIRLALVNADGSIGSDKEFGRKEVVANAQHIDNAAVETKVVMPADIQQQLADYEKEDEDLKNPDWDELRGPDDDHPSYGAIRLSRISGQAKLFMSPFHHQHFIGISISRATKKRSLADDHMFGGRREIIEVLMSEAQFAQFITGHSDGNGTPCTLHHITGQYMPEPPWKDEKEKFSDDTKATMNKAAEYLAKGEKEIGEILSKKSLSKADKEKIVGYLHEAYRKLTDSLPFIADQMQERFDKIVAKAGIEVEAHMNRLVSHMGLKALTGGIEPPIRFLDTSKKPELPPKK